MKFLLQLCMCFITFACASNADAMGLGKIRIDSFLGQPLEVRVAFDAMGDTDVSQLRVRVADSAEYREMGLQYPEDIRFVVEVAGGRKVPPYVRIFTLNSVDELFINLLLEVSSPSGKLFKAYTILPDPSPDPALSPDHLRSVVNPVDQTPEQLAGADVTVKPPGVRGQKTGRSVKSASQRHRRNLQSAGSALSGKKSASPDPVNKVPAKLTISRLDPNPHAQESNDALQEKLIVTEKRIEELNGQIAEMQAVIGMMQSQLALKSSGVPAINQNNTGVKPVVVSTAVKQTDVLEMNWWKTVLALILLAISVLGLIWYNKTRRVNEWEPLPFEEPDDYPTPPVAPADRSRARIMDEPIFDLTVADQSQTEIVASPVRDNSLSFTDADMIEHFDISGVPYECLSGVPHEYVLLMKAKEFSSTGDYNSAIRVLQSAIDINPGNPHCYLPLLRIYEARGDAESFESLALQLRGLNDENAFSEATVMGRSLDPTNPLYR